MNTIMVIFIYLPILILISYFTTILVFQPARVFKGRCRKVIREMKSGKARVTPVPVRWGRGLSSLSTAFKVDYSEGSFIFERDPTRAFDGTYVVSNSVPMLSDNELGFIIKGSCMHSLCIDIIRDGKVWR